MAYGHGYPLRHPRRRVNVGLCPIRNISPNAAVSKEPIFLSLIASTLLRFERMNLVKIPDVSRKLYRNIATMVASLFK